MTPLATSATAPTAAVPTAVVPCSALTSAPLTVSVTVLTISPAPLMVVMTVFLTKSINCCGIRHSFPTLSPPELFVSSGRKRRATLVTTLMLWTRSDRCHLAQWWPHSIAACRGTSVPRRARVAYDDPHDSTDNGARSTRLSPEGHRQAPSGAAANAGRQNCVSRRLPLRQFSRVHGPVAALVR